MLYQGCSMVYEGYSRLLLSKQTYSRWFQMVELRDCEFSIPRIAVARRILPYAEGGFFFTLLAPRLFGETDFAKSPTNLSLLQDLSSFALAVNALAVVFTAPESFAPGKAAKLAVKEFFAARPKTLPTVVLDFKGWRSSDMLSCRNVVAAYNPLRGDVRPNNDTLSYARVPAPSNYDFESHTALKRHRDVLKTDVECGIVVFENVARTTIATLSCWG